MRELGWPGPVEWLALGWIGLLWVARHRVTGRWTVRTALNAPIVALLFTVPAAVAVAIDPLAAVSRAESLVFAVALYYALANAVDTPQRAWSAVTWLLVAGLGLASVGLVSVEWLEKYPVLTKVLSRIPRVLTAVPHPTLQGAGVHPNTLGGLLALFVPLAGALLLWPGGSGTSQRKHAGGAESALAAIGGPPHWIRRLSVVTIVVIVPIVLLTQSRGTWLALAAALWFMAAWRRPSLCALVGGAAVSAILLVAAMGPRTLVAQARAGELPGSVPALGRAQLWRDAADLLADKPISGIGSTPSPSSTA